MYLCAQIECIVFSLFCIVVCVYSYLFSALFSHVIFFIFRFLLLFLSLPRIHIMFVCLQLHTYKVDASAFANGLKPKYKHTYIHNIKTDACKMAKITAYFNNNGTWLKQKSGKRGRAFVKRTSVYHWKCLHNAWPLNMLPLSLFVAATVTITMQYTLHRNHSHIVDAFIRPCEF